MKTVFTLLILIVMALCMVHFFYAESTYKYRVTVPDGRTSRDYYTNGYKKQQECLSFRNEENTDSTQVCGTYTLKQIN